jgi:TetR/AcrR family transcriptional regulator, lmrAB and yxaGH operons repressor
MEQIPLPVPKAQATSRSSVTTALFGLFRDKGYEGVSIADVSAITGLGRSSLYHYFPGGKAEMASSVLEATRTALATAIFTPLSGTSPLAERIDAMLAAVSNIYDGGLSPCVLSSLMTTSGTDPISKGAASIIVTWITILTEALKSEAISRPQDRAIQAVALIQGALVTARALGRRDTFSTALENVRRGLLD